MVSLSVIHLHKTGNDYDPSNKQNALQHISEHKNKGEIATGLLYINQSTSDLHELQDTVDKSFNQLTEHDFPMYSYNHELRSPYY